MLGADFIAADRVILRDRRLTHMKFTVPLSVTACAWVDWRLDGQRRVGAPEPKEAELVIHSLDQPPPAKLPLTLLLALPRPKMLRRVLQTVASMGAQGGTGEQLPGREKLADPVPGARGDSRATDPAGAARDSVLPEIIIEKRFKPFVEDRLPALAQGTRGLVGHPGDYPPCPRGLDEAVTLTIGPEGGWIPYEIDLLANAGLQPVHQALASCESKPPSPPCLPVFFEAVTAHSLATHHGHAAWADCLVML